MTPLEDDVRERFASIAAPGVPAPSTALLRKRAHRIRSTRVVAAAASLAVVAAGVTIGATTLNHQPQKSEFAGGVTAVPGHLRAVPPKTKQWQVADTTLAGKHLVAVSFRRGTSICITGDGGGTCELAHQLPSTVADVGDSSDGNIRSVGGFVPMSARTVVVHVGTLTSTVTAVRTPTSNTRRFFVTWFVKDAGTGPGSPLVGVFDGAGRPVPPDVPAPHIPIANSRSHVASLPAEQWSFDTLDGGYTSIAYRQADGTACVAATNLPTRTGTVNYSPRCASAAPASTRVLLAVRLPSGWTVLLGDAPTWVTDVLEWGSGGMSSAGTQPTPAASDRVFWAMSIPPASDGHLASAAAGGNVVSVTDLAKLLPHR